MFLFRLYYVVYLVCFPPEINCSFFYTKALVRMHGVVTAVIINVTYYLMALITV